MNDNNSNKIKVFSQYFISKYFHDICSFNVSLQTSTLCTFQERCFIIGLFFSALFVTLFDSLRVYLQFDIIPPTLEIIIINNITYAIQLCWSRSVGGFGNISMKLFYLGSQRGFTSRSGSQDLSQVSQVKLNTKG